MSQVKASPSPSVWRAVLMIVAIIVGLLCTGYVAASHPEVVLGHEEDCDVGPDNNRWSGMNVVNPTNDVRAIKSNINPLEATFRVSSHGSPLMCGWAGDVTSALVELYDESDPNNKIQIGVWRCNETVDPSWCDTGGNDDGTEVHWFMHTSGCGNGTGTADLGDANYQDNEFKIKRTGNTVTGEINGVVQYSTDWTTHPRLSCWLDGSEHTAGRVGAWLADGGSASAHYTDYLNFTDQAYIHWESSTWQMYDWGSVCDVVTSSNRLLSYCAITGTNGNGFNVSTDHTD